MGLFNDAFLPFIAKTRLVLLILDNHVSHWFTYAIDAGRDNGVDLQFFPSHSFLHLLQPLDVVYFHALKQKGADISVDLKVVRSQKISKAIVLRNIHVFYESPLWINRVCVVFFLSNRDFSLQYNFCSLQKASSASNKKKAIKNSKGTRW
jgi:hypothetical protein